MYDKIYSKDARNFCNRLFQSYGFNQKDSDIISDILLDADFCGIESHGLARLVRYDEEIKSGSVDIHAVSETIFKTNISAVIDAHKSMGQLVSFSSMQYAIENAKKYGICIVTVKNSNHFGVSRFYTRMASKEDLIGICMTNTEAIAVPTFGKKAMLGTNPIALAMPADPVDFSFDASTTVTARGKIDMLLRDNAPLPLGWAVDKDGKNCTDAQEIIHNIINKIGGGILPLGGEGTLLGGHKGFGLGILVELFTGILSGGLTSNYVNLIASDKGFSHCFIALDYGIFGDRKTIKNKFSKFLQEIRESPAADSSKKIYIPGEIETELKQNRSEIIPISKSTLNELKIIADKQKIPHLEPVRS
jgi:LDH2 family malate/lactate/ureidoglycolate dehydrogenase